MTGLNMKRGTKLLLHIERLPGRSFGRSKTKVTMFVDEELEHILRGFLEKLREMSQPPSDVETPLFSIVEQEEQRLSLGRNRSGRRVVLKLEHPTESSAGTKFPIEKFVLQALIHTLLGESGPLVNSNILRLEAMSMELGGEGRIKVKLLHKGPLNVEQPKGVRIVRGAATTTFIFPHNDPHEAVKTVAKTLLQRTSIHEL